jgi:hypothetical protein
MPADAIFFPVAGSVYVTVRRRTGRRRLGRQAVVPAAGLVHGMAGL